MEIRISLGVNGLFFAVDLPFLLVLKSRPISNSKDESVFSNADVVSDVEVVCDKTELLTIDIRVVIETLTRKVSIFFMV